MPKGGRMVTRRLTVPESELEDVLNELMASGWGITEAPEEKEQGIAEFYRKEVSKDELLETINQLTKDGWEQIGWENDDEAFKPWIVNAVKFAEPMFRVNAARFLRSKDEVKILRQMVAGLQDDLEAKRIEDENAGETGEEEEEDVPASEA